MAKRNKFGEGIGQKSEFRLRRWLRWIWKQREWTSKRNR